MADKSNKDLLAELGVEVKKPKKAERTLKEEKLIKGFEELQLFVEKTGREPRHGEEEHIFERLYAKRLDKIRKSKDMLAVIEPLDFQQLLTSSNNLSETAPEYSSNKELLSLLGLEQPKETDITYLKHVKSQSERKAAEDIATRTRCRNFDEFKSLFNSIQKEVDKGRAITVPFIKNGTIDRGDFFILSGQKAYVAEVGNEFKGKDGRKEYRLRVIFDNGIESDQLMRSFQKRLWEDASGRRIVTSNLPQLFGDSIEPNDSESGVIYVLRSKSTLPIISENRTVIHKVGVTSGSVKQRIANASIDPTFLMADVEVVASYELFNINRNKLEKLLHKVLGSARLDINVNDRFGNPVKPKEWFLVPLFIIDEVVEKIKDGSLTEYRYDKETVKLIKNGL